MTSLKETAQRPPVAPEAGVRQSLPHSAAALLVFGSSAAVLILEILAVRLVAPYIGINLQVNSAVIGTALAAIAVGVWAGGRAADSIDPRRLIGWMLSVGGVTVLLILPIVRWAGQSMLNGTSVVAVVGLAALAVFIPATMLSAVTPLVVKLQLRDLHRTGRVVGQLSSLGTLGAILATFVTGFILVAALPSSVILLSLGIGLVLAGVLCEVLLRGRRSVVAVPLVVAVGIAGGGLTVASPAACDVETTYNCARVVPLVPGDPTVQVLLTSNAHVSYVDMLDASRLHMGYVQAFAAATDLVRPGQRLDALHIGGGAMTFPTYLELSRPAGDQIVYEIDPGLVDLAKRSLNFAESDRLRVTIGDGRLGLQRQPDASVDVVVEDAFGAHSPPWHLTTVEVARHAQRALRPGGLYLINMIDFPPAEFARAEVATLRSVFAHVVLISYDTVLDGSDGGNVIAVASDQPIPVPVLQSNVGARDGSDLLVVADEQRTARYAGQAPILTDDLAPVDQLVTIPFRYW
jgi:spermidine synthase